MKLSVSMPNHMAEEIKGLSEESDRPVSWWIQKAWDLSRSRLLGKRQEERSHHHFLNTLSSLQGVLKEDFPETDSVSLSHQAFAAKPKK